MQITLIKYHLPAFNLFHPFINGRKSRCSKPLSGQVGKIPAKQSQSPVPAGWKKKSMTKDDPSAGLWITAVEGRFFHVRFIKGAPDLPQMPFLKNSEKNSELVPGILIGCYRPIQIHLDIHTSIIPFFTTTLWWKRHNYRCISKRRWLGQWKNLSWWLPFLYIGNNAGCGHTTCFKNNSLFNTGGKRARIWFLKASCNDPCCFILFLNSWYSVIIQSKRAMRHALTYQMDLIITAILKNCIS